MTTAPLQHLTLPDKVEDHYDVYGDTTSLHGYRADELVSALQKSIRRGLV
jgi:hypothetical protein